VRCGGGGGGSNALEGSLKVMFAAELSKGIEIFYKNALLIRPCRARQLKRLSLEFRLIWDFMVKRMYQHFYSVY
jgi:hypothetical protein